MSIYLSIATLEDFDIADTVISAIQNADDPKGLYIGVAATTNVYFYESAVSHLGHLKRVSVRRYDPIEDRGIGKGRNNAKFAYDGQDYIVQVDSHTHFTKGWDTFVTKLYEESITVTGTDKTIATGYLAPYIKKNGVVEILDTRLRYCVYSDDNFNDQVNIKCWEKMPIGQFPGGIVDKRKKFFPANKIGADFMIGNDYWAAYSGLPDNLVFWEEEVVQSVNLLNNGFALVFPNVDMPMTHRYWGTDMNISRQGADKLYNNDTELSSLVNANMQSFIKNNLDACVRYAEYCGYDLVTNSLSGKIVPDTYGF